MSNSRKRKVKKNDDDLEIKYQIRITFQMILIQKIEFNQILILKKFNQYEINTIKYKLPSIELLKKIEK